MSAESDLGRSQRSALFEPFNLLRGTVGFEGRPAAVLVASADEIWAQVPFGLGEGPVRVDFTDPDRSAGARAAPLRSQTAMVQPAAPSILQVLQTSNPGLVPEFLRAGEECIIVAAGLGELNPSVRTT